MCGLVVINDVFLFCVLDALTYWHALLTLKGLPSQGWTVPKASKQLVCECAFHKQTNPKPILSTTSFIRFDTPGQFSCPDHPGPGTRQPGGPYTPEPIEIILTKKFSTAYLALPVFFPWKPQLRLLSSFPPLPPAPSASFLTLVLHHVALHGVTCPLLLGSVNIKNSLFNVVVS